MQACFMSMYTAIAAQPFCAFSHPISPFCSMLVFLILVYSPVLGLIFISLCSSKNPNSLCAITVLKNQLKSEPLVIRSIPAHKSVQEESTWGGKTRGGRRERASLSTCNTFMGEEPASLTLKTGNFKILLKLMGPK